VKRRRWLIAGAAAVLVVACCLIVSVKPPVPSLSNHSFTEVRGYDAVDGMRAKRRYFIRAPFATVKREIEALRYGSGSSTFGSKFYGCHSDDTGEAFMVYPGKASLPDYPYMGNPAIEPGTEGAWSTLVYTAPRRPLGLVELIRRLF
jgi:hypothetical protein